MIGDSLFQTTNKDRASVQYEIFDQWYFTGAALLATLTASVQVPADRMLVLKNLAWFIGSGAQHAQYVHGYYGDFASAASIVTNPILIFGSSLGALSPAGFIKYDSVRMNDLVIPPGKGLSLVCNWAAADANNALTAYWTGYTIPRGNFAFHG